MNTSRSTSLFARAERSIPGGVNSPVRAFRSVGGGPLFIRKAEGSRLYDEDGNVFVDYVGSWGPMILGHAHPEVLEEIKRAAESGSSFGAPTEREVLLAEMIIRIMPSIEMVRMVNSGTEATMSAIRLARAYTEREKIIKFEGCYHGHGDSFLIKAGSGAMTFGVPDSPGVPAGVAAATLNATYNDLESVSSLLAANRGAVAAIIVEPVVGNMGCVPPIEGFLAGLRELCTKNGVVLIFDEVMTGFRLAPGGAQQLYGVVPDLTTLGKIIGGGLPVGAYGGKREIMNMVSPSGPMYQAGTLSGNPLAMAAGLATLSVLTRDETLYRRLEQTSKLLADGIDDIIRDLQIPVTQNRVGSMATVFFTSTRVRDYSTAVTSDTKRFAAYFRGMLSRGIYLAPSQFEAGFVSLAHSEEDIAATLRAVRASLKAAFDLPQ